MCLKIIFQQTKYSFAHYRKPELLLPTRVLLLTCVNFDPGVYKYKVCNYIHCKYGARILINSQTSMFAALKFGNGITSYFIPQFTGQVMNYPCLNQNYLEVC